MHKKLRMMNLLAIAALLWADLILCNTAKAAEETDYATIGWWRIKFVQLDDKLSGCNAIAQFQGQTAIRLSLLQHADENNRQWVVHISNPQWNVWVDTKKQHLLHFIAVKRWQGTFSVANDNSLYELVSPDFINSLADAHTLTIMSANNYVLSRLSMKDSEAAIRGIVTCVREHPPKSYAPEARTSPSTPPTSSFGTAFFVAPNLLVSNNHVVKDCRTDIEVRYPNRRSHTATISGQDSTNDLVMLHTDMESLAVASFRLRSEVGESVATYGFPYAGLLSSEGNFTMGTLAATSGMNDDTRFLQISAPIQPGNSGGPLLDMSASVIGVVRSQLSALAMMQFSGSVPQNVNFAIHAPIVVNFLLAKGGNPKSDNSVVHQDLPPAKVAELAKKFTVQVYCGELPVETSQASPPPRKAQICPRRQIHSRHSSRRLNNLPCRYRLAGRVQT
jgi:serine protease Do